MGRRIIVHSRPPASGDRLVVLAVLAAILAPLGAVSAQTDGGAPDPGIPGDLIPIQPPGPVGSVDAQHKFDAGFHAKIQGLIAEDPQAGDPGVHDGTRYYNVIIVVSRDDGDARDPEETARENKGAIVKRLELVGARDIAPAGSLSFVTASVPVADIPGFSLHDEVYRLGDGELPVVSEVDMARQTIHATPDDIRSAVGRNLDGSGVIVGVLDSGIYHDTAFAGRVLGHVACNDAVCTSTSAPSGRDATHGTRVAQVLAASGLPRYNGIAPGVDLLDIQDDGTAAGVARGLDYALKNGADVVNMSFGLPDPQGDSLCGDDLFYTATVNLIINEAVDKGMVAIKSAGNQGLSTNLAAYESITYPGCGSNVIAVGGINDRGPGATKMYIGSSRGPSGGTLTLKPEIVAPAVNIQTLDYTNSPDTSPRSGTSLAAPQVSATAAMMLQLKPDLTPVEIKAGLLLGADWQGPVPCTSSQYERNNARDNCSHAMQHTNVILANNAASLERLNNVGFGILNTSRSLEYVSQRTPAHNHVMGDHLDAQTTSRQYSFEVDDASDPVKVILTWMAHPHGNITEQAGSTRAVPAANLNFVVTSADGRQTVRAESRYQTNEFAVFSPSVGNYTVTVTGLNLDSLNKPVQNYAIASTHSLSPLPAPFVNRAPIAQPSTVIIDPDRDDPAVIRLHGTDQNGDALSFSVSDDPDHGTATAAEFISETVSRMLYTPGSTFATTDSFRVTPQDGLVTGRSATVTVNAESLPPGSTKVSPRSSDVLAWDTVEVTSDITHAGHSGTFPGPGYAVSALHVGSGNMEGVDLSIRTSNGKTYTMAVPDGARMIEIDPAITIRSVTLSADGIDEEAVHQAGLTPPVSNDIRMFVGYVSDSCPVSGAREARADSCPALATANIGVRADAAIPDNTRGQDTSSTAGIPQRGTLSSVSVSVDITHTYTGDLVVTLTPPGGTPVTLHNREGGSADDIDETYTSSSVTGLGALAGSQIAGDWTLSVGDHARADVGTLNGWGLLLTYTPDDTEIPDPPAPTHVIFSDDFESGLSKWTEEGEPDWRTGEFDEQDVPGSPAGNMVAEADGCRSECMLVLRDAVDLTAQGSAELSFYRFVDGSLDSGEYLRVDLYDGTKWNTAFDWRGNVDDDDVWHMETHDLADYTDVDDFKVRFVAKASSSAEDLGIDDVMIAGDTAVNRPPSVDAIASQSLDEGETRSVGVRATDPDGDSLTLSAPGLPSFATFSDDGGGRGTLTLRPGYGDSGTYTVRITASDGTESVSESFAVTVSNVNRAPLISNIPQQSVNERDTRSVSVRATDPDGDSLTLSAPGLPSFGTFSDRGGGRGTITFSPGSGDSGTYTITVRASDGTASDSESFTLTVRRGGGGPSPPPPSPDTTPPAITAPGDVTAEATGALTAVSIGQATATDNRDPSPDITNDAPESFQLGATTVTWTATDDAGNSATATQTVTVRDTTPPDITAPADYTAEATGIMTALGTDDYGTATATDLVDSDPEITSNAPDSFQIGTTTITWTATDDAGNSATATQTVTVRATAAPVVTAPADYAAEATAPLTPLDADDYGTATATDLTDPDPEITSNAPASFPLGDTVITWTATDDTGNSATATQTITIRDTTPPAVTAPADHVAEAIGVATALDAGDYGTATAMDLVDPDPEVESDAPASFPLGDTVITWTATDDAGNSATAAQTITVRDTTPPMIAAPADYTAEATGVMTALDADDYGAVTATDLADPDLEITNDAPDTFPLGETVITWTATDGSGNSANATQTVTVRDTTPPVIEAPGDLPVAAPAGRSATASFEIPGATDLADPDVDVSCTPEPGAVFPSGTTTVTCTATDGSGNESRASFAVRVGPYDVISVGSRAFDDGGASWTVTGPASVFAGKTYEYTVRLENGTASPAVSLAMYSDTSTVDDFGGYVRTHDCRERFCVGFPGPSHQTYQLDNPRGSAYDYYFQRVSASDGPVRTVILEVGGSAPAGETVGVGLVVGYGTRHGGVTASVVEDTAAPVLSGVPQDMSVTVQPGASATADFALPTAADDVDPDVVVSCTPEPGAVLAAGTTTVTCTATDASGNESSASFDVHVTVATRQDVLLYDFEFGGISGWDMSGGQRWHGGGLDERTDPPGHPAHNRVAAANGCTVECVMTLSSPVDMTRYDAEVLTFYRYVDDELDDSEYLRADAFDGSSWHELDRWTPEDSDGDDAWHLERYELDAYTDAEDFKVRFAARMSSYAEEVAVDDVRITASAVPDTAPPVITAPPDVTFEAAAPMTELDAGDYGTATATDLTDPDPEITSDAPGSFPLGDTVITWTATDSSGNAADATQTVTVRDTTPPVITAPPDVTAAARGIFSAVDLGTATVTDAADPDVTVTGNATAGGSAAMLGFGATTILWTATDASGNAATAAQTATVDPSGLDTAWQYRLVESYHLPYAPHAAVTASMDRWSFSDIDLRSTGINNGTMYLFKSFPAAEARGGNLTVSMVADTGPYVGVSLLDGAYSADAGSDFGPGGPAPKGGGTLASYERPAPAGAPASPSDLSVTLAPDWAASRLDRVTLLVETSRPPERQSLLLRSVDVGDGSRWVFDGYGVSQGTGNGTLDLFPADPGSDVLHALPLDDTFDSSLDGWTYRGSTSEYVLEWRPEGGRGAAHLHIDGFGIEGGMQKAVDVSGLDDSRQRLVLSYDYRASSDSEANIITHSRLAVLEADSHALLHHANVMPGGTTDTGWRTYTTDITGHAAGHDAIRVFLHLRDGWLGSNDQRNWYDNVRLYTLNQTAPVPTTNTRAQ